MATPQSSSELSSPIPKGKELEAEPADGQLAEGSYPQNSPAGAAGTGDSNGAGRPPHEAVVNGRADTSANRSMTAEPGQVPPSTQSAQPVPAESGQAAPPNSLSASAPSGKEKMDDVDRPKEAEKDKASLNTTLTGTATNTATNTRAQSSPRKEPKSVSDGAHTASTSGEEPRRPKSPLKKKAKGSIVSRIFRVLVPCVGPSTRAHDIQIDRGPAPPSGPSTNGEASKEKEKTAATKEAEDLPPMPVHELPVVPAPAPAEERSLPAAEVPEAVLSPEPEALPPPLQPVEIPAAEPTDEAVVVPPTPTKSLLPKDETEGMTSGAVQPPGSTGDDATMHDQRTHRDSEHDSDGSTNYSDEEDLDDGTPMDEVEDDEERLILNGGAGIPKGPDGMPRPLLPPISAKHAGRKCLVLDLDETLVHSSFKSIQQADYVVPVEIEYHWHNVYVIKRPGVDNFLKKMGEIYEVVVFTASLSKYADPVLDKLDIHHVVSHRLFRESCYNHRGNYVKDLSQLGRPISDTIIIDNSPASYIFHPNNAVPVSSWFNDPHDTELTDLCPFLTDLCEVDDVRGVLDGGL